MSNNQDLNSNQEDDKTIIYSSSNKSSVNDDSEKTIVNDESDKTQFQSTQSFSSEKSENSSSESETIKMENNKVGVNSEKTNSNSMSTAGIAASVVGAGISGTVLGTIFSEDIKEVLPSEGYGAPDSPESDSNQVSNDNPNHPVENISAMSSHDHPNIMEMASNESEGNIYKVSLEDIDGDGKADIETVNAQLVDGSTVTYTEIDNNINPFDNPADVNMHNHSSYLDVSSTDSAGNIFSVSLADFDGDGDIDYQSANVHYVDGTSVTYTETGDNLNPIFSGNSEIANGHDFHAIPDYSNYNDSSSHVYEIQSGDTLSEIAKENHTSVQRLMELNPDINDPNMIYANHELIIPNNDNISNPYEGGIGLSHDNNQVPELAVDAYSGDLHQDHANGDVIDSYDMQDDNSDQGNYDSIDWSSYSDDPVQGDNSNYHEELANTNFEDYNTPDSYQDSSYYESGNDFVSSEFI